MKRKIIALLLCFACVFSLCLPVAADDDGYSAIISDIDKTCPTCGSALHAFWWSTSGAEVEVEISDTGKIKIPAGAGAIAHIDLKCKSCGYEKKETRLLGLDFGAEKPGKLVEAPSSIGRKDLPGYADDNGTPTYNSDGNLQLIVPVSGWYQGFKQSSGNDDYRNPVRISTTSPYINVFSEANGTNIQFYNKANRNSQFIGAYGKFEAPVTGTYEIYLGDYEIASMSYNAGDSWEKVNLNASTYGTSRTMALSKGQSAYCYFCSDTCASWNGFNENVCSGYNFIVCVKPVESLLNKQINITINNDYSQTWNGNIYTDNSTNLTYIYPQYTTINEKNETVTNISNTPIIYNNETKQYYTYDQTTKNYYYITYNSDPAPSPTPTPAPTDKPGGSISTPETGKPGNSSGSSWWDKLLSKIGDAIIDGLLGAVSAVLKLIFKLFSTILSWIIWAVSRVFDLLPFLPPGLGGLLVGGVVVCFVIGIIKFIRG